MWIFPGMIGWGRDPEVAAQYRANWLRREAVVKMFNLQLRREAEGRACRFIDLYAVTAGPDGFATAAYHIDGVHLDPSALQAAIG